MRPLTRSATTTAFKMPRDLVVKPPRARDKEPTNAPKNVSGSEAKSTGRIRDLSIGRRSVIGTAPVTNTKAMPEIIAPAMMVMMISADRPTVSGPMTAP
jgi:hypothetical protein